MVRRWKSFDSATTNAELLKIPQPDRRALTNAMARYRDGEPSGFETKNYGEGLWMIKATNRTSGRCLFFTVVKVGDVERLVARMFYKKESDDAPPHLIGAARERRGRYLKGME